MYLFKRLNAHFRIYQSPYAKLFFVFVNTLYKVAGMWIHVIHVHDVKRLYVEDK